MRVFLKTMFLVTVVVFLSVITTSHVSALTVSPAKIEITGDPGKTIQGEIELFNEQEGSRTFFSSFENFEPAGESGAPRFIGANGDLATWLSATEEVTIASGERKKIPFAITIPNNAQPGGHFAAIFWGSQAPDTQGGGKVSIGGKIGILVLLRVSGDVPEQGGLLDFTTPNKQHFWSALPILFTYRLNNSGGDRVVPLGEIQVKNMIGMTSVTLPANKNEGSVLPGSARKFEVAWGGAVPEQTETAQPSFFTMVHKEWNDFHFGWYTATLHVAWGSKNQVASAAYHFFVIPWQILICIIAIIFVVGVLGIMGIKRYNRWLIAKVSAQRNGERNRGSNNDE